METDTDRSQILADFQACTNIDDIETALAVLEGAEWDLTRAINMVLSNEDQPGLPFINDNAGASASAQGAFDVTGTGIQRAPIFQPPPEVAPPSRMVLTDFSRSSSDRDLGMSREVVDEYGVHRRLITFHAQYREELLELSLTDSQTVDDLKDMLSARIDVDKSTITIVWDTRIVPPEDNITLREMKLPRENTITIISSSDNQSSAPSTSTRPLPERSMSVELSRLYNLQIEITLTRGHVINLDIKEPGTKTVLEVKEDIQNKYGIPISSQNWNGWSSHVTDDMTLAGCQLNIPIHMLTVCRRGASQGAPTTSNNARTSGRHHNVYSNSRATAHVLHSDSDSDNDMIDDNDMDIERLSPPRTLHGATAGSAPLIPGDIDDDAAAVEHMNVEFGKRYGHHCRPHFYAGALKDAVEVALHCTASERRLLAVYIHHDRSIAANIFCQQILCSESIVNYLSANFLTWGWDITLPPNKTRFLAMFSNVVGREASEFVRHIDVDQLPVLVVLAKLKGSFEVLTTVKAACTTEEMMSSLLMAEERFHHARQQDIVEEEERKERERVKASQDAAYEASLAEDRKKQNQKEEEELMEKKKQDDIKLEQETMEAMRQSVANSIPDEPPIDCKETMSKLRFRCPDGKMLNRRFLGDTALTVVFNYLLIEGYRTDEYKLLTTFPRRDLTQVDADQSLLTLKLCPQETLILEAR